MHRSTISLFKYAALAIGFAIACGPQPIDVPEDDDDDNDSGGSGTGASAGFGGASSGATFTGGTPATGGFSGTAPQGGFGGTVATGGVSGTPATGGAFPGGTPGTGGIAGTFPQGGTGISGSGAGTPPIAGTGGTGPATSCDATWKVGTDGFVRTPAAGGVCWHGYGFTAAGPAGMSTIMPASFATCGATCTMLCASGSVAATTDYSGTGLVGFNLNQAVGGTPMALTPAGTTGLTVNFTNTGGSPLRVQILGPTGDTVATDRWCFTLTATTGPVTVPWAMFNTQCWEGGAGTAYDRATKPIKAIQLIVPGSNTAAVPFNMCLTDAKDA